MSSFPKAASITADCDIKNKLKINIFEVKEKQLLELSLLKAVLNHSNMEKD